MAPHTITLQLPPRLYQQLEQRAADAHRSVEAELLEVVAIAVPATEELEPELREAVTGLSLLDDDALWQAARGRMPQDLAARLEELHWKRQAAGLAEEEERELSRLMQLFERNLLVRAEAAKILHQRGHEISPAHLAG